MTTKQKYISGAIAIAATVGVFLLLNIQSGFKGFYDNSLSSYFGIASAENAQIAWHKKNGDNAIYQYGFDSKLSSSTNFSKVSNYVLKARRNGIITFGVPYSSANITSYLQNYNSAQSNDSCRINALISEIEPYNDGNYAGFYSTIRSVSNYCVKNNIERNVYMGWPTTACWDTIIRTVDVIFMHCYIPSDRMSGSGIYSYCKSRLNTVANLQAARYPGDVTKKMKVRIIFSCESSFAYTYFQTHSWDQPYNDFITYVNTSGDAVVKQRIQFVGRQIFVSSIGKQIKP